MSWVLGYWLLFVLVTPTIRHSFEGWNWFNRRTFNHVIFNRSAKCFFFRPMVETILRKIPLEMMERIRRRRGATVETVDFGSDPPTEKTLIKLHRQVVSRKKYKSTELTHNSCLTKGHACLINVLRDGVFNNLSY